MNVIVKVCWVKTIIHSDSKVVWVRHKFWHNHTKDYVLLAQLLNRSVERIDQSYHWNFMFMHIWLILFISDYLYLCYVIFSFECDIYWDIQWRFGMGLKLPKYNNIVFKNHAAWWCCLWNRIPPWIIIANSLAM